MLGVTIVAGTCDASNLFGPTGSDGVSLSYVGDTILVAGRPSSPVIRVRRGGADLNAPRLRYWSTDSLVLSAAPGGELLGKRRGVAALVVSLESSLLPSGPPSLTVPLRVVAESVTVHPQGDLLFSAIGDTATLTASMWDATGSMMPGSVLWESSAPVVASVGPQGLVKAVGNGTAQVRAIADLDTVAVRVVVRQRLVRYRFEPPALLFEALGATATVKAIGEDARGQPIPPSAETAPVWTSRAAGVATVDADGNLTARQNGFTYLIAQRDDVIDSLRVDVAQRAVRVVITSLSGYEIRSIGGELQLTAIGLDSLNQPVGNDLPSWSSLHPTTALVDPNSGLVVATGEGVASIVAAMDGVADTARVTVTNAPASVELRPSSAAMTSIGDTVQFAAGVRNERGDLISSATVRWHTPEPVLLQLSDSGRAVALAVGTARVIAASGEVADTAVVTITNEPVSIDFPDASTALTYIEATVAPVIEIRNARGALLDRSTVSWSSDDPAIARVSATGAVTARDVGETMVRATYGSVADSIRVSVTNEPASLALDGTLDTLTAPGQSIGYTGEVRNEIGALLDYPIAWRSSNTAVAGVSSSGVVTAMGYGSAFITGQAGVAADTVVVVVVNPTMLHVDNAVVVSPRFGTLKRPFARIQDAVAAADASDTVFVRRGYGYSEMIAISRRITILGDSADFLAAGRDPLRLPRILHDSGSAGILAHTSAPVTIRYLSISHSLDGAAIDANGSDVRIDHLHVNPVDEGFKIGRGILIRNSPTFAMLSNVEVRNVRAYGVRLDGVSQGQLQRVIVRGVDSLPGTTGAGIVIRKGTQNVVSASTVRSAQGPLLFLDSTLAAAITGNDLAGRTQLIRVRGATGDMTRIERNTLDLTLLADASDVRGSADDGRSGLQVRGSHNVHVRDNVFVERGTAVMDAVRVIDARGPTSYGGALLARNRFLGGRHHMRSERSSWTASASRSDSAVVAIVASDADSVRLEHDTLAAVTGAACLQSTGANAQITVIGGRFSDCAPKGATLGGRALHVSGTGASLTISNAIIAGADHIPVDFSGRDVTLLGNNIAGSGARTVTSLPGSHAIQIVSTQTTTIVGNIVADHANLTGIHIDGRTIRVDSNLVARNRLGIRLANWQNAQLVDNDVADQEVAGVSNALSRGLSMPGNWWGDARGPRRDADITATGDSAVGPITFNAVRPNPLYPGSVASALRIVRGDGQSGAVGTTLPRAFTARVVDASGRPVGGVAVTFAVTEGGGRLDACVSTDCTVTKTSDPSGLAEATLTLGLLPGTNRVSASATAVAGAVVSFAATGVTP